MPLPLSGFGALRKLWVFLTPPLQLLVVLLTGQDAIVNGLGGSLTENHLVFCIIIKALGRRVLELKSLGSHRYVILLSICLAFAEEGLIEDYAGFDLFDPDGYFGILQGFAGIPDLGHLHGLDLLPQVLVSPVHHPA